MRVGHCGGSVQEDAWRGMPGVGSEKQPLIMPDAARACRPAAPALPGLAGQQRLELARAVQCHHLVVAADVGVADEDLDRKSVVSGKSGSVRVALGGRRNIKKTQKKPEC